jgi:outer membrane protein assembly factor BamB
MRGAPALAGVAVIIGVVSALVLLARLPSAAPGAGDVVAAATTPAAATSGVAPGLRWRQALEAPVIGLHVIPAGVVAVTRQQVIVLDPETGQVQGRLGGRQASSAVTADGGLVTAGTDGVQARDVDDGSVEWTSDVTGVGPPDVTGETIYRVSDGAVPRLVATAAGSGRRLWEFPEDEPAFPPEAEVAPDADFVYVADREAVYGILPQGESIGTDTAVIDAGATAPEPLLVWQTDNQQLWLSALQAVSDGVVTADRSGDVCLRRDADGDAVWCVPVAGVAAAEPELLTDDDSVYVVTGAAVTAIDTGTGDQRWTRPGAWGQAVLTDDGHMVAVGRDGEVAVLEVDTGGIRGLDGVRLPPSAVLAVAGDALYAAGGDGAVVSVELVDPAGGAATG